MEESVTNRTLASEGGSLIINFHHIRSIIGFFLSHRQSIDRSFLSPFSLILRFHDFFPPLHLILDPLDVCHNLSTERTLSQSVVLLDPDRRSYREAGGRNILQLDTLLACCFGTYPDEAIHSSSRSTLSTFEVFLSFSQSSSLSTGQNKPSMFSPSRKHLVMCKSGQE